MKHPLVGLWILCIVLGFASTALNAGDATGPLTVHSQNPRYLADAQGQAVYLTGSHTWSNLQEERTPSFNVTFDFNAYLDLLQQHNHNFIRLWRVEMPRFTYPLDLEARLSEPHPWLRTASAPPPPGPAPTDISGSNTRKRPVAAPPAPLTSGEGKFDLTQFNPEYFTRLRERCIAAGQRGIYVSIMLFEGHSLVHTQEGWNSHPFNFNNNINNINGDPNNDGRGIETHTLQLPAVTNFQRAYIRKVIDTVNDLDNVMYEISNESHPDSVPWQLAMIDYINAYQATKPQQHLVWFTTPFPYNGAALWTSNAQVISPPAYSPNGSYSDNPPAADGSKVVIADSDHIFGCGSSVPWIWKSFTRGLHVIYMDSYYDNTPFCLPPDHNMRRNMGYTLSYAQRMNLANALPRGDLTSTNYCLADVGDSYVVYAPNGGTFTLNLAGTTGPFQVEWLNPQTGMVTNAPNITGGNLHIFTPPFTGHAVLFVWK